MSRKTTIATSILADQDPLEGVGPIGAACDDYVREMEFVDEYRVAIYWFSDGSAIVRSYFGDDWNLFKHWYDGKRSLWSFGWGSRDDHDTLCQGEQWMLNREEYLACKAARLPANIGKT